MDIKTPKINEDIFEYIHRVHGKFELNIYRKILGSCNEFKEGDQQIGVAANSDKSRINARILLANTKLKNLQTKSVFSDELEELINRYNTLRLTTKSRS